MKRRLVSLVFASAMMLMGFQISALSVGQTDQKRRRQQQFPSTAPAGLAYAMTYAPFAAD